MKTFLIVMTLFAVADNSPVKVVTDFYSAYLNKNTTPPFFSKSLEKLFLDNKEICKKFSRGDDICGYSADGDIYLNAQESAPDLNIKNSEFKARLLDTNTVEATFTVMPGDHDHYFRKLKFKMIKEDNEWRVKDIFYDGETDSMVSQITKENTQVLEGAKKLSEAWTWVSTYVRHSFFDRFLRFMDEKVEVCDEKGRCKMEDKKSKEVESAYKSIRKTFSVEDTAKKGPFVFAFKNGTWWIVKMTVNGH